MHLIWWFSLSWLHTVKWYYTRRNAKTLKGKLINIDITNGDTWKAIAGIICAAIWPLSVSLKARVGDSATYLWLILEDFKHLFFYEQLFCSCFLPTVHAYTAKHLKIIGKQSVKAEFRFHSTSVLSMAPWFSSSGHVSLDV